MDSKSRSIPPAHHSIRIILLNEKNELLLMKAEDPSTTETDGTYHGSFWFLIGGEIEREESTSETALREIKEETGLVADQIELGPVVWYGDFFLILSGVKRHMKQKFLVARANTSTVSLINLTKEEKQVVKKVEWFDFDRIQNSKEIIYPVGIENHLEPILKGNYPKKPSKIKLDCKPNLI